MNTKSVSVFFPCVNEEGNIRNTVKQAERVLQGLKVKYEIIIIDDGSKDKTGQIADELAEANPYVKVIHHPRNLGYGEALKSGFYNASYDVIVYTDGDRQFNFSEVSKFLEKIRDHDLVIGYRIKRQDSFIRKLFGKGWRLTLLAFFGLTLKDVDCGFKMVTRRVLKTIPHLESQRGAMINAELVIKAKKYDFKIGQVGVNHYPRLLGKPTGANLKVIIKSYLDLLKLWWKLKNQKFPFILLIFILTLAAFLRFYKLSEYMTFLGDEGRDALVIKDMLTNYNIPFIGPPSSVGNIYLGPLYYYMMAIPMSIFWLDPVAAAGMNAFLGVISVALIYYFGTIWFNRQAGLAGAYLYAISPVTIIHSRSSWNPNPVPFFSLLAILGLFKAKSSGNYQWLILTGISAAAAVQMHYLALILLPVLLICWIKWLFERKLQNYVYFWRGIVLATLAFLLLMLPLVFFDLKHNFLNYRAITTVLFNDKTTVNINFSDTISKIIPIYSHDLVGRYIAAENPILTLLISVLILLPIFWVGYLLYKKRSINIGVWVLNNWLLIGVLGLALYKQNIYDHYLGFLNPVPFILLGAVVFYAYRVLNKAKWLVNCTVAVLLITLTVVNLQRNPLLGSSNNQLAQTQEVAKFIISESRNKDFNFALLAQRNYDPAYQFYLETYGRKPKLVPFEITDQLFVVCEDPVCEPINNPKYEIAAFGWAKIAAEQNFYGVKVFKLVHNPSGKP